MAIRTLKISYMPHLIFYWGSAQNSENANQQHMLRNLRHIILSYHIATFVFSLKEMYCIPELGMK